MAIIRDPGLTEQPTPRPAEGIVQFQAKGPHGTAGKGLEILGEQIGRGVDDLYRAQKIEEERADTARVEDAWNKYKSSALDMTLGDNGLFKTQGEAAVTGKIMQRTQEGLQQSRKQLAAGLDNDIQRSRFSQRADATDLQTMHQALVHIDQQTRKYAETVMEGSFAAAKTQVAAMPENMYAFEQARATLLAQADAYLKTHGVQDEKAIAGYKAKLVDGLWEARIDRAVYSNPVYAEALLRQNEKEITDPKLLLQLQGRTREAALAVGAANDAQNLIDEFRDRVPPSGAATTTVGDVEQAQKNITFLQTAIAQARTENARVTLEHELETETQRMEGLRRVSAVSENLAPSTNGLPNSRDIAAQLPLIMLRVEKRANELYGSDPNNPDRMAYIKRVTTEVHARIASDVHYLNAIQRNAQGILIDAVTGNMPAGPGAQPGTIQTGGGGEPGSPKALITSFSQIQGNPTLFRAWQMLDPQAKLSMQALIDRNLREADHGDVVYYRELWNRIHLEPGDPKKIEFYKQITDPAIADRLSIAQIRELRAEIDRAETPGGRSIVQQRKAADANVAQYFKTHIMFTAQPERQIAATMRWNEDTGRKVDEYVRDGKPVRSLFMLDTPDSVISPKYLQTYVDSTPAQGVSQGAAAVHAGEQPPLAVPAPIPQPAAIDTREKLNGWMNTLEPGTPFRGLDGKTYRVPPRAAAPGAAAALPVPELITESGKVAQPPTAPAEIPMPKLVSRMSRRKVDENFPTWSDVGTGVGKAVDTGVKAAQGAGEKIVQGATRAAEAVTPPSELDKAVGSFRAFLRAGQFTKASGPTIQAAIDSGQLTGPELVIARKMLTQIGTD